MIFLWFGLAIVLTLVALFGWYLDFITCKNCGQPLFYSEHEKEFLCVTCGYREDK